MQKITPFLWFEKNVVEAAKLYTTVFKGGKILGKENYDDTPSGQTIIIPIEIMGLHMTLMEAGPHHEFNDAVSFEVSCEDQAEVDYYWNALTADGGQESQCGWLIDKFGVRWQIVPKRLVELMSHPDEEKRGRVVQAMLKMKKIIISDLENA